MSVCMCMCVCTCVGQCSVSGGSPQEPSTLFFETQGFLISLGQLVRERLGSSVSSSPVLGL